jgi:hypothetical protein
MWTRLFEASTKAPLVIVVNPDSGPGDASEKAYADAIAGATAHKIRAIGYVNTRYGKRPLEEVKGDIERWNRYYPEVRGFFFDAQSSDAGETDYYETLYRYAKGRVGDALIVSNPGTLCAENYFSRPATDAACVFEQPDGFDQFSLPLWAERYAVERFAGLPYNIVGHDRMRACVREAARKRLGYIYVTDGNGTNPWGQLPSYWEAEVDAVRRVNQRQAP